MINQVKHLLSILLLFQCLTGFSQEKKFEVDSLPYEARYSKLKDLYIKRIDSDSYKNSLQIGWAYYDMLNTEASDNTEINKLGLLEWSKSHLYKTDFGSPEEAEREWKKIEDAMKLETMENADYWNYFLVCLVATKIYDIELKIEEEVKREHPEKFMQRPVKRKKESYLPKLPSLPKH